MPPFVRLTLHVLSATLCLLLASLAVVIPICMGFVAYLATLHIAGTQATSGAGLVGLLTSGVVGTIAENTREPKLSDFCHQ